MATISFKGSKVHTSGELPTVGSPLPSFRLVDKTLSDKTLDAFKGKTLLIATVPSLDTGVCSAMTKKLNEFAKAHPHLLILTVSADLPFAQGRFCEVEKVQNLQTLSMMRDKEFGKSFGLLMQDGPLAGLLARALIVADRQGKIIYRELVPEITQEPDYEKVFAFINSLIL